MRSTVRTVVRIVHRRSFQLWFFTGYALRVYVGLAWLDMNCTDLCYTYEKTYLLDYTLCHCHDPRMLRRKSLNLGKDTTLMHSARGDR